MESKRALEVAAKGGLEERFDAHEDKQKKVNKILKDEVKNNHEYCVTKKNDLWIEFNAMDAEKKEFENKVQAFQVEKSVLLHCCM
jgi:hypothetical protein